jgi:hypothetical protein
MAICTDCSKDIKKTQVKYWFFQVDKPREVRCHPCYKKEKIEGRMKNETLR